MELFGLFFALPIGFLVSRMYANKAAEWLDRNKLSAAVWTIPTIIVLLLACIEAVILVRIGAYQADQRFRAGFAVVHLIVLLAGAPAVGNAVLLLSRRLHVDRKISLGVATLLCLLAGMTLLLTNIAIDEDIHGINGEGHQEGVG